MKTRPILEKEICQLKLDNSFKIIKERYGKDKFGKMTMKELLDFIDYIKTRKEIDK